MFPERHRGLSIHLEFYPQAGKIVKKSLIFQRMSRKDDQVHFIQPLLVDVGGRFEMHKFLFFPNHDFHLLGRVLMANMGM